MIPAYDPRARLESYRGRRCVLPTLRLRHALGWIALWSTPGETAGIRERYQCAAVTLLCGRQVFCSAGSNAVEMRNGVLTFARADAPWSAGRQPTFYEAREGRLTTVFGRAPDQETARSAALAAVRSQAYEPDRRSP